MIGIASAIGCPNVRYWMFAVVVRLAWRSWAVVRRADRIKVESVVRIAGLISWLFAGSNTLISKLLSGYRPRIGFYTLLD